MVTVANLLFIMGGDMQGKIILPNNFLTSICFYREQRLEATSSFIQAMEKELNEGNEEKRSAVR